MTERQEKGWTCLKEKQPAGQIDFAEGSVRRKTLAKLDAVGGRRAFLINLIAEPSFAPACTADDRLVELPGLLLPDGTVNRQAMQYLGRWL